MVIKYADILDPEYMGSPCDGARIAEIEKNLRRKLPESYAKFIMETGGGYPNSTHDLLPGDYLWSEAGGATIEKIYGNGILSNGDHNSIDHPEHGADCIARTWEYPDEALLFAIGSGGPHVVFMINYDLEEYPLHSILCINDEMDIGLAANSFEEFVANLTEWVDEDEELE